MFEVKQQKCGDGTSLFIITKDGKRVNAFVADQKSDKEMQNWMKELNGDELKTEGSRRRKRISKKTS